MQKNNIKKSSVKGQARVAADRGRDQERALPFLEYVLELGPHLNYLIWTSDPKHLRKPSPKWVALESTSQRDLSDSGLGAPQKIQR